MKRFIIGGASDNLLKIKKGLYDTGTVIGVNDWFLHDRLDIYCVLDFGPCWRQWRTHIMDLLRRQIPVYARGNPSKPPFRVAGVNWFMRTRPHIPEQILASKTGLVTEYKGYLSWWGTSCMAAVHLAICLGADEVILAGFDCYGKKRWNGYEYRPKDLNFKQHQLRALGGIAKFDGWTHTDGWVNRMMRVFTKYTKIYKTHPKSPLACEYLDPNSNYAQTKPE